MDGNKNKLKINWKMGAKFDEVEKRVEFIVGEAQIGNSEGSGGVDKRIE